MKYRSVANTPQFVPELHRIVQPNETFETPRSLNNGNFVLIKEPASPAKED